MKSIDANSFGRGYHYKSRGQDVAVAVIVKILLLRGIPSTSIDTALSKGTVALSLQSIDLCLYSLQQSLTFFAFSVLYRRSPVGLLRSGSVVLVVVLTV